MQSKMCNVGLELLSLFGSIMDSPNAPAEAAAEASTASTSAAADAETATQPSDDLKEEAAASATTVVDPDPDVTAPVSTGATSGAASLASVSSLQASHFVASLLWI